MKPNSPVAKPNTPVAKHNISGKPNTPVKPAEPVNGKKPTDKNVLLLKPNTVPDNKAPTKSNEKPNNAKPISPQTKHVNTVGTNGKNTTAHLPNKKPVAPVKPGQNSTQQKPHESKPAGHNAANTQKTG